MDLPADAFGSTHRRGCAELLLLDTLLFCGAILLLANSIDKEPDMVRI